MSESVGAPVIAMPPVELRRTVGVEDVVHFENPHRMLVFGDAVPADNYGSVFDFGCGCGRVARQMLLMQPDQVPKRFVGVDLYAPSIDWCKTHLAAVNANFVFRHFDVFNAGLNPSGSRQALPLPQIGEFSLVNAHSVFTHIIEDHIRHYFMEFAARVEEQGVARATWFLFNKAHFPMMQAFQNSLYINTDDPTNAVIYDIEFVKLLYREAGLDIYRVDRPGIRGHQWVIYASRRADVGDYVFPEDDSAIGLARPPVRVS